MFLYPLTNTTENEMKPTVVGFVGNWKAGKDTCCDYLRDTKGFVKVGFSDPLYEILEELNPVLYISTMLDEIYYYKDEIKRLGVDATKREYDDARRYLQVLGQSGREIHGDNCWIDALDRRVRYSPRVAIRDVRHTNEIDYIRARGGIVVWVQSNRAPDRDQSHASEHLVFADHADYTVQNNGTLVELYRQLDVILADWNNSGVSK
jgi:hypothetical protein